MKSQKQRVYCEICRKLIPVHLLCMENISLCEEHWDERIQNMKKEIKEENDKKCPERTLSMGSQKELGCRSYHISSRYLAENNGHHKISRVFEQDG